ncbi:hypothetical protein N9Y42_10725 [Mariniblastus sp.]|nr:hypothetical protein [Mariniblastus sp.]
MIRKRSTRRTSHSYQSLEARQLLASISFDGGEVVVQGNSTADVIELVGSSDFRSFTITINDDASLTETFQYSEVTKLSVFADGGNDRILNTLVRETVILGGTGDDYIEGGYFDDVLYGGNGVDTLIGRNGNDQLFGQGGADWLYGVNGSDRLFGSDGNDHLFGGNGEDVLAGGAGNDELHGEQGIDRLFGGVDNDHLFGEGGDDRLFGQAGNDELSGGSGNDFMMGNADDDLLNGNEGEDTIYAGVGDDTVNGGADDDFILGVDGTNLLRGNGGKDTIYGGGGEDRIEGGDGNDLLAGNAGEDHLLGDGGNDVLYGGADNDTLSVGDGDDFAYGQGGDDFLLGLVGENNLFGNGGNDSFHLPTTSDRVNGGAGVDQISLLASTYDFRLDRDGSDIVFTDLRIPDEGFYFGPITTTSIEQADVLGEDDPIAIVPLIWKPIVETVVVQPIVVSDNDGSNTATGFGNAAQEAELKRLVDRIYNQAGVDIEFLPTKQWNNTFANGTEGDRDVSEFGEVVRLGNAQGIGSSNTQVLDYYFVSRVPGLDVPVISNGRASLSGDGAMQASNEIFLGNSLFRARIAEVFAHEIGHNLGLNHDLSLTPSLLDESASSGFLKDFQITQILNSRFTEPV